MNTLLILFCVAVLSHADVSDTQCVVCKKGAPVCNTPYLPSGPVSEVCRTAHLDLCRKYDDYTLSCSYQSGNSFLLTKCTARCISSTISIPSMTTLFLTSAVLTLVMKSV